MPALADLSVVASAGADPSRLTGLAGWVVDVVNALGPMGVGALVALETVFPPLPSEVVLPVAGFLAGQVMKGGGFGLVGNLVVGVVGALVGGVLFRVLGLSASNTIGSLITATVGAIVFLWLLRLARK